MNDKLKLLIISLISLLIILFGLKEGVYWNQSYQCSIIEYEYLNNTYTQKECIKKPPANCWSNVYKEQDIKKCQTTKKVK